MFYKLLKIWIIFICCITSIHAQQKTHAHNDYSQKVPFWSSFSADVNSIEVDVLLKNNTLYVAHNEDEIIKTRTIENLYLKPLQEALKFGFKGNKNLQLLIDVKSEAYKTLDKIIEIIEKYPSLIKANHISFTISGKSPKPLDYKNYPDYIKFDYQSLDKIPSDVLEKIALISLDFGKFSDWNGKGRLTKIDKEKIISVIKKAHGFKKFFRFWGTPDSKTAWKTFTDLGVDFINTDKPFTCVQYLKSLPERNYTNSTFSKAYNPTFKYDQKSEPVKNIILLIGDGNGLTQLSAAILSNKGDLTITKLKSIGLIKTQSFDDFTTDSAAAGTALATGKITYNRAIGVDYLGNPIKNIMEVLQNDNYNTGIITTDDITGATPSAFYAHQKDRGNTVEIAAELLSSKLNFFSGGGKNQFKNFGKFKILNSVKNISKSKSNKIGFFMSDYSVPGVLEGRGNMLAEVTAHGLNFLKSKKQPFFLMVESAKIDSYAHMNNVAGVVSEGIDFDKAITKAIAFADDNKGTLVIITADHETGGFTIPQGNLDKYEIEGDFTTEDHTGTLVPIFTYGPHSDEFTGVFKNSDLFGKIMKLINASKK